MNVILSVLKFCCKALNFIRNLVMNFVFLLFVLALIVLVSLFSDGKKSQVLSGDQGALYLNLTGYLADNTEDMLSWSEEFQRLNNEKVSYKYSTFDVVQSILSAKDDERIRGLVLNLNDFEGGDLPSLEYVGKAIQSFKESQKPFKASKSQKSRLLLMLIITRRHSIFSRVLRMKFISIRLDKSAFKVCVRKIFTLNPCSKNLKLRRIFSEWGHISPR